MAEPGGDLIANRERKPAMETGLRGSVLRYLAAWMVAVVYLGAPQIGGWWEGPMRVALSCLVGGAAVLVAFALGLVLRIRALGRDWHSYGVFMGFVLAAALAALVWHREVATWIVGMPPERVVIWADLPEVIALGAWFTLVFLIVNFPKRARVGLRFAETFSAAKRRWLLRGGYAAALVAGVVFFLPAPLAGYWHTPYSDCLCDSKNLLVFEDGRVFQWASAHGVVKEPYGTYRRHFLWVTWDTGKEKVEIRPGWLLMRLHIPDGVDSPLAGRTWFGGREWRRDYIREVLATNPAVVRGSAEDAAAEK